MLYPLSYGGSRTQPSAQRGSIVHHCNGPGSRTRNEAEQP
jgi:hypothetical protein